MGYGINSNGFHLSMCHTDFKCPKCTCHHDADDYQDKLQKSKKGYIYKKCKGCKTTLGITYNVIGDVVAWLKEEEDNH